MRKRKEVEGAFGPRRRWLIAVVLVMVLVVIVFLAWRYFRFDQDRLVCASRPIEARVATGGTDEVLEGPAISKFSSEAPSCVSIRQIHRGSGGKSRFFFDEPCVGDDLNEENGIDRSPLFFFVGHGDALGFSSGGETVRPGCMRLGNSASMGRLRYYLQCSCEVFAHGKAVPRKTYFDYPAPGSFNGPFDTDSSEMRNVFRRWGMALGDGFRLACGSSTALTCAQDQMSRVWMNKRAGLDVSTSFLEGVQRRDSVPLCIGRGSGRKGLADPETSALFDSVLSEELRDPAGDGEYYFISYTMPLEQEMESGQRKSGKGEVQHLPFFSSSFKVGGRDFRLLTDKKTWYRRWQGSEEDDSNQVEIFRSVFHRIQPLLADCPSDPKCRRSEWFRERARAFIDRQGWYEQDIGYGEGFRLLIDGIPVNGGRVDKFQKGVIFRFQRVVVAGAQEVREDDIDGNIVLEMNNNGDVVSGWKYWVPIEFKGQVTLTDSGFENLAVEARKDLGSDAPGYKLDLTRSELIYRHVKGNLVPFVSFHADPVKEGTLSQFPPRKVEVRIF